MSDQSKKSRIPRFKSVQEEAEFWDTHDTTEFEDEFKEVKVEFARPLSHILAVRLDAKTIGKLARVGARLGIGPSTLVRMWAMERLEQFEDTGQARPEKPAPAKRTAGRR